MENTKVSSFNPVRAISQYRQYFSLLGVLLFGSMTGINCAGNLETGSQATKTEASKNTLKSFGAADSYQNINFDEDYEITLDKNTFYYLSQGTITDAGGQTRNFSGQVLVGEGRYLLRVNKPSPTYPYPNTSIKFKQLPVTLKTINFAVSGSKEVLPYVSQERMTSFSASLSELKNYVISANVHPSLAGYFFMELVDPDGNKTLLNSLHSFKPSQPGQYQINVFGATDVNFIEKSTSTFALNVNQSASATIQNPGEEHLYQIPLQAGKRYALMPVNFAPQLSTQNNTSINVSAPANYPSGMKIVSLDQADQLQLSYYAPTAQAPVYYFFNLIEINSQDVNLIPSVSGTKLENALTINISENKVRFDTVPGKTYVVSAKKTNNNATNLVVFNDKVDQLFEKITATGTSLEYTVRLYNPGIAADYVFEAFEVVAPSDTVYAIPIQPGAKKSFYIIGNSQDNLQFKYEDGISASGEISGVLKSSLVDTQDQVVLWYTTITLPSGATAQLPVYGEKYIFGSLTGTSGKNYTGVVLEDGKLYRYDLKNDLANTVTATMTIKK